MDKNFNKYFALMGLLFGGFVATLALLAILFYVFKVFSIAIFNIPGSEYVLGIFVVTVPYLLYFGGYYYLHTKIAAATTVTSRLLARLFLVVGSLACAITMVLVLCVQLKTKLAWINDFGAYSQYAMIAQVFLLLITAGIIATGDPKEKNWMEKTDGKAD